MVEAGEGQVVDYSNYSCPVVQYVSWETFEMPVFLEEFALVVGVDKVFQTLPLPLSPEERRMFLVISESRIVVKRGFFGWIIEQVTFWGSCLRVWLKGKLRVKKMTMWLWAGRR